MVRLEGRGREGWGSAWGTRVAHARVANVANLKVAKVTRVGTLGRAWGNGLGQLGREIDMLRASAWHPPANGRCIVYAG